LTSKNPTDESLKKASICTNLKLQRFASLFTSQQVWNQAPPGWSR